MRTPSARSIVRTQLGVIAVAASVLAAVLIPVGSATADPAPVPTPHHTPLAMGTFSASAYAGQAAQLPAALASALTRDVDVTPAEYLADAAATVRAVKVVASLKSAGVHVLGSKIDGTHLTVNVASSSDTATVNATGATAVVGAPAGRDFSTVSFHSVAATNTYGGQGYYFQNSDGNGFRCSIGFNGFSASTAAPQFVTAGHCATIISGNAILLGQNLPTNYGGSTTGLQYLGTTVPGEAQFGSDMDYGIVAEGPSVVPLADLYTWGGGTGAPLASAPLPIIGQTAAIVGAILCKSGSTSGWSCGNVQYVDQDACLDPTPPDVPGPDCTGGEHVNAIEATTCLLPGDSGGGAVIGQYAVGINSGSNYPETSCAEPSGDPYSSVFFPMVSAAGTESVSGQQGANWTLMTAPANTVAPTVSGSTTVGSTWTVNTGTWTGTPAPTFSIYWLRCNQAIASAFTTVPAGCSAISGANATTYVATVADAGKYVTAQLAGINPSGFGLAGAASTTPIQSASPVNTVAPTVSGSPTIGSTWTVSTGTWTGTPAPTFAIYWLRCNQAITSGFTTVPAGCSAISGANASTYVVTAADAGKYLTVQVAGSNPSGFALAGALNSTSIVAAVPVNTVLPSVSGSPSVGSTWSASTGTWTGTPAPTFGIYWLRCTHSITAGFTTVPAGCTAISGATGSSYVVMAADAGKYLTVQIAGSNTLGFALAGAVNSTAIVAATPVNTVLPSVSGATTVGSTWTANTGTWTGTPAPTFGIYWLRCTSPISAGFTTVPAGCSAISGANASTYVVVAADAGKYLTVQVAGSNTLGFALAGAVNTTAIVSAAPVNTVAPTVSGAAPIGSTWTVTTGTWTGTPAPTFGIYWLRCASPIGSSFTTVPAGCSAISGANGTTYVSTAADIGKYLTAQLAGSNSSGFALAGAASTVATQGSLPVNTVAPTVSGSATVGSTWTVNTGTWTGSPTPTIAIYWLRCTVPISSGFTAVPAGCTAISGANSPTYISAAADVGKYLSAQLAGSNVLGYALAGAVNTVPIHS
jgi:hypothetical protein